MELRHFCINSSIYEQSICTNMMQNRQVIDFYKRYILGAHFVNMVNLNPSMDK